MTISGGASIRRVISIAPVRSSIMARSPCTRFFLRQLAQPVEIARPHLAQYDLEGTERPPIRLVVTMGSLAPFRDQPGIFEHAQVLGDRRPAGAADWRSPPWRLRAGHDGCEFGLAFSASVI